MGWKNIKEHYRIQHVVQVTPKGICIGSPYIHDLMIVGRNGIITKRYEKGFSVNEDLARYQQEMDEDPGKLIELALAEDHFSESIPVFTYSGSDIIEKRCEVPGWPNVTHDGELMYNNLFSTCKDEVVRWAWKEAEARIRFLTDTIEEKERGLAELRSTHAKTQTDLHQLQAQFPATIEPFITPKER